MATERRRAAAQLMAQGLVVVPYTSPWGQSKRPGKMPLWDSAAGHRAECRSPEELEPFLITEPDMNVAVLGIAQVDCDDEAGMAWAKDYGISRSQRAWFVRSSRGWKALYRPPAGDELLTRTKAGCTCRVDNEASVKLCSGWHPTTGGKLQVDFLVDVPSIVPPSVHPTFVSYRWADGHSPSEIPFAKLEEPPVLVLEFWRNLCRHKTDYPARQLPQGAGFEAALRAALAARTKHGHLPSEGKDGWIGPIPCVFSANHAHGDRQPGFTVNFRFGVWKCHAACGTGSLVDLATELNVPVPGVKVRRGRIGTGGVPSGAYMSRDDLR